MYPHGVLGPGFESEGGGSTTAWDSGASGTEGEGSASALRAVALQFRARSRTDAGHRIAASPHLGVLGPRNARRGVGARRSIH